MSSEDKLSKIEKDVSVIKRWWPAVTAIVAFIGAVITITFNATSTYDNKIAKKDDIAVLIKQNEELKIQVSRLADDFRGFKSLHYADSLQNAAVKQDLATHITVSNAQYKSLITRIMSVKFFTEKKVGDKLIITPVGTK